MTPFFPLRRRFESHFARFAEEAILFGRARVTPELARVVGRDVAAIQRAAADISRRQRRLDAERNREIASLYLDGAGDA